MVGKQRPPWQGMGKARAMAAFHMRQSVQERGISWAACLQPKTAVGVILNIGGGERKARREKKKEERKGKGYVQTVNNHE